jgi:hypothetical protein
MLAKNFGQDRGWNQVNGSKPVRELDNPKHDGVLIESQPRWGRRLIGTCFIRLPIKIHEQPNVQ